MSDRMSETRLNSLEATVNEYGQLGRNAANELISACRTLRADHAEVVARAERIETAARQPIDYTNPEAFIRQLREALR